MSGPVLPSDLATGTPDATEPELTIVPSHEARVGSLTVRRALPRRGRRTVGAWCFADHMGPHEVVADDPTTRVDIGPHPHIGLQTVTWLTSGILLHRDSLGTEQTIEPGQLNLMTAGHGVSHSEESLQGRGAVMQGIQLWVAQPEATRHGPPDFEHHGELPVTQLEDTTATVLVGSFGGVESPARHDTALVGVELLIPTPVTFGLVPEFEYALVVIEGAVSIGAHHVGGAASAAAAASEPVGPGQLVYLAPDHDELSLHPATPTRVMLLGGEPFESQILMWWNFVARSRDEVDEAAAAWGTDSDRFGETGSPLDRIPAPPVPW